MAGDDSTLHDEPIADGGETQTRAALWVLTSPDGALLGRRFELPRERPFLLGRKVERDGMFPGELRHPGTPRTA